MLSNKVSQSIEQVLTKLARERDRVEKAIARLQRQGVEASEPHAGKPSVARHMRQVAPTQARSREGWTESARAGASLRMKTWWAEKKASGTVPSRRQSVAAVAPREPRRSTRGWTQAKRNEASARMQAYWAERRGTQG